MNTPKCDRFSCLAVARQLSCPKHPIFTPRFFIFFPPLLLVISSIYLPHNVIAFAGEAASTNGNEPTSDAQSVQTAVDAENNEQNVAKEPAVTAKILRYANRLLQRYDADSDGRMQESEWKSMRGDPASADRDGDRIITLDELSRRIAEYGQRRKIRLIPINLEDLSPSPILLQPTTSSAAGENNAQPNSTQNQPAGNATPGAAASPASKEDIRPGQRFYVDPRHRVQGLPSWFAARDTNGDQQISMAEFAPKATESDLKEFAAYDADGDGVVTAKECAGKASSTASPQPAATQPASSGGSPKPGS